MGREQEEAYDDYTGLASTLYESDRGRAALRAIYDLVQGPAGALDSRNQKYMIELLQACYGDYRGTAREAIEMYLD